MELGELLGQPKLVSTSKRDE